MHAIDTYIAFSPNALVIDQNALDVQVVKVAGVGLYALFREKKEKPRN